MYKLLALIAAIAAFSFPVFASDPLTTDFIDNSGAKIGTATLKDIAGGTLMTLDVNLPEGTHAFHIHENAKCEAPDFKSAGGHFNPENHQHGYANEQGFHAGDLPNLFVESTGHIKLEIFSPTLHLAGAHGLSQGTSLVIHEKADDYSTDPSGNAGSRIACAGIKG